MDSVAQNVLPANRGSIDQFLAGVSLNIVHFILGGLRDTWEETPHLNAVLFERFKEHVDHEENSIRKVLQNLVYNLDGMDTVTMVLGQGRPEKVGNRMQMSPVLALMFTLVSVLYMYYTYSLTDALRLSRSDARL